ncbi:MAG: hypothetical protein WA373_06495 [Burkholderiales bacterium]
MGKTLLGGIAAVLALSGCAARYSIQSNGPTGVQTATSGAQVNVSTGSALGTAIIVGIMLADGFRYYRLEPDGTRTPVHTPEPDPSRRINAQDCTRPVDPGAGNLLCR